MLFMTTTFTALTVVSILSTIVFFLSLLFLGLPFLQLRNEGLGPNTTSIPSNCDALMCEMTLVRSLLPSMSG